MSDIFISYRRGDGGWAGRLRETLDGHFDVYFDTDRRSNDYGDDFPAGIEDALATCRVVLAVIGPEWNKPKALKRLADATDWVRRELTTALGRPTVRVVPVLVGDAARPAEEKLPPELRPLVTRKNECVLTHTKWTSDCDELVARMRTWLSGPAFVAAARRAIPAVLPYLCDRVAQEEALVDLVHSAGTAGNVLVFVVHGHKWESHDGFLQRLRHRRVLEDVLDARDVGIMVCPLEWNRERAKAGHVADALKRAVKASAMQRRMATDAELQEFFGRLPQPLVLVMQVTWSDYLSCGEAIVRDFLQAWDGLFGGVDAHPPPHAAVLWLNVTYDEPTQELDLAGLAGVLPKLPPITQGHVQEWMGLDDTRGYTAGREAELLAVTEDARSCIRKGEMHMLRFAEAVTAILGAR